MPVILPARRRFVSRQLPRQRVAKHRGIIRKADPEFDDLHRVADEQFGPITRLLKGITVSQAQARGFISTGTRLAISSMDPMFAAIAAGLKDPLERVATRGARLAVNQATPFFAAEVDLALAFSVANEEASAFATQRAASLVVEMKTEQVKAIRGIISTSLDLGRSPDAIARDIRQVIGLNSRLATAQANFIRGLESQDLAESVVRRRAQKNYDRLLTYRSQLIARTETINAATQGQVRTWNRAVKDGTLPSGMVKVWITAGDRRVDPDCIALDGSTVPITEAFNPDPPLHASCRCALGLIRP